MQKKKQNGQEIRRGSVKFQTYFHIYFKPYYELFYDPICRKKRIPVLLEQRRNARVLAYWFMDDGSSDTLRNREKVYFLHTNCFTHEEVLFCIHIREKNGIFCVQHAK